MKNMEGQGTCQVAGLELNELVNYDVYDKENKHIGEATALWTDHAGQPAFLGVKTTWLFGKTHVVPAQGAEVNPANQRIRIPFYEEDVKNAPHYDPEAELDLAKENEVYAYYRPRGLRLPSTSAAPAQVRGETRTAEEARIPLREEQVKVGKRSVEAGGVRLRKIVRTERVNQPVELRREEIVVERVPGRAGTETGQAFQGEEIYIPLRREEAVVEKETRVREEVRVRKQAKSEKQTVSETVRKEDVEVLQGQNAAGERKPRTREEQPRNPDRDRQNPGCDPLNKR